MSRIRSIHPGFPTDENFITVSRDARLFFLLLLTECDDQGVFVWKPLTLKMRLFPGDNIEVAPLLSELVGIDAITAYETDRRKYGAVRNFRKFQRPKSPNAIHPLPPDFRNYVGLSPTTSEIDDDEPPPVPGKGEKSPQMEDGGGNREDGEVGANAPDARAPERTPRQRKTGPFLPAESDEFERWYAGYPHKIGKQAARLAYRRASLNATTEQLLAGRDRYISSKPPDRQWCNPATWLNQERWLDQPDLITETHANGHPRKLTPTESLYAGAAIALAKRAADRGEDYDAAEPLLDRGGLPRIARPADR